MKRPKIISIDVVQFNDFSTFSFRKVRGFKTQTIFALMKSTLRFILIIMSLLLTNRLSAQSYKVFKGDTINRLDKNKLKQGLWRKYFSTDTLFSEGVYRDDIPVGVFRTYHENGFPQARLSYRGKSMICDAEIFSLEGKLIAKGKYNQQKKDSVWLYYDDNGILTAKDIYKMGKKDGICLVYYPNGNVSRSVNYKADVISGAYNEYFESGSPKIQATMQNGEFIGQALVFHPNGNIWQKGSYTNGLKDGNWVILKEDGQVDHEELYSKGKLLNPSPEGN